MANHDLILGQNHNRPLGHDQHLVLGHNHNLNLSQNHALELGSAHGHHLDLGQTHDHELDLGHAHDHEFGLGQNHGEEGDDIDTYGHEHDLVMDQKSEHDDQELSLPGHNHELVLSENNDLTVSENREFDGNMDLAMVHHNPEMGIDSADEMGLQQSHLVVCCTPHVIQARTVSVSPSYELSVGQEFPDVKSCRRALRDTAIALHFEMQTIKSDKTRFTAKCASEGCLWRIHAAKLPGVPTFTIRTIHESHTCGGISHLGHQQASVQWVANSVEQRLKENPNCKPKEILEEIHRSHGITLSYKQAWRGKERIMAAMRGSFEEGYRLLPQYCEQHAYMAF
ncbi:putative transposase, MuDR, plant [Lupinus albus]|uniref:Putative transposase, MuDR, plant n=1 Tax=Lupinus albus TaxID=3870 RepID=A0A6A4QEN1_LUPAL|nr:putative transposase, MuDR, plant [Lupinus albus]